LLDAALLFLRLGALTWANCAGIRFLVYVNDVSVMFSPLKTDSGEKGTLTINQQFTFLLAVGSEEGSEVVISSYTCSGRSDTIITEACPGVRLCMCVCVLAAAPVALSLSLAALKLISLGAGPLDSRSLRLV